LASIIVPCRNERAHIRECLETLLASDYPADRLEILVVDGMSDDGTRDIVAEVARAHPAVRLFDNPRRITPAGINIGIAEARGSVFLLIGAHAGFPPDYVSGLVGWLERSGADGVGGVCETLPGSGSPTARAIALAMAHPFGVGNSWFRIGTREPRAVDTVPFPCYRMELFGRIGLFDEALVRNQDDEFNARVLKHGGRLLLVPGVSSRYYARTRLRDLARMFYQYGLFKPAVIRKTGAVITTRQLVPATFTLTVAGFALLLPWWRGAGPVLAGILGLYCGVAFLVALRSGRRHGFRCVPALVAAFPVMHLSYGIGFLVGLIRLGHLWKGQGTAPDVLPLSR